jgi:hypothetical protein
MPSDLRGDRSTAGAASRGASSLPDPISPELVLVAPPDEARRAREQLPEFPTAESDRLRSSVRVRAASPSPPRRAVRPRRRWVRRTLVAAVLAILVASAVTVGLAGSRHTNDDSKGHLALGPVRHQSATTTSAAPTTTAAAKSHAKSAPRRQSQPAEKPKPKAHATPRPSAKKKPSSTSAKKRARTRRPPRPAVTGFVPARTWSWEPQSRARRYVFTLQRNGTRVVAARTAKPRYVLPKRFLFAAGRYRWRVVALTTKPGARRKLVVDSKFRLSAAGAAAANG